MLNVNTLKQQIQQGFTEIYKPALETIILNSYPKTSNSGKKKAAEMAKTWDELTAEPMAEIIANAIDYYIKNANITGTLITYGSPGTHTGRVVAAPTPIVAGKIPNTLGIS